MKQTIPSYPSEMVGSLDSEQLEAPMTHFDLDMGGPEQIRDLSNLLKAGGILDDHAERILFFHTFPLNRHPRRDEIELVESGFGAEEEHYVGVLSAHGLERPTLEHTLRFALKYGRAEFPRSSTSITFLHPAWKRDWIMEDTRDKFLQLDCHTHRLDLMPLCEGCMLAGVRPS